MKIKIITMLCFIFICVANLNAQKDADKMINQFNAKRQKEGLWVEDAKYFTYYTNFRNGKSNGVFYSINKSNNSLSQFGELTNGEYSGTFYMFSDDGHLMYVCKDFTPNSDYIPRSSIIPKTKCYCIIYYPNGSLENEGYLLFSNSPIVDGFGYGEWKYYDEKGNLKESYCDSIKKENINKSKKEFDGKVNLLNTKGQKEGLWIEDNTNYKGYTYFHKGKPNGIFYCIKKWNNSLIWFGEDPNGEYSGTYYMFDDDGHLMYICKNFKPNKSSISLSTTIPESKCYCINYYPNGYVESEGILLFSDSPVVDSFEYGEWKYYDENGNFKETKVFK